MSFKLYFRRKCLETLVTFEPVRVVLSLVMQIEISARLECLITLVTLEQIGLFVPLFMFF